MALEAQGARDSMLQVCATLAPGAEVGPGSTKASLQPSRHRPELSTEEPVLLGLGYFLETPLRIQLSPRVVYKPPRLNIDRCRDRLTPS